MCKGQVLESCKLESRMESDSNCLGHDRIAQPRVEFM